VNIRSKKGYVLPIAIFFVVLAALTSIGIYANGYFVTREIRVDEVSYVRGYFLSVAALRYAYIRLQDPSSLTFTNHVATLNDAGYTTFKTNIGLSGNENLVVTIERWHEGVTEWNAGEHKVSATYSS